MAGLRPLVSTWFQILFTSLAGELFIFQSPYWSTIGRQGVFSLAGWTPQFHAEFHELDATLGHPGRFPLALQGFHPLWPTIPDRSGKLPTCRMGPATPARRPVWALPISLAATDGIEVSFFSFRYLDVSVP